MAALAAVTYASDPVSQAHGNSGATTMVGYSQAIRVELALAMTAIQNAVRICAINHPLPANATQNYAQVDAALTASIATFS